MKKVQKMFKKAVSMLVAVCLMIGIANIPAYARVNTISATKTTDAVLSKEYVTPAQALKKTVKNSAKATAKPTATKISNSSVKNKANQSLTLINKLLKKKGLSKVAKTWLTKAKTLINNTLKSKKSNSTKYTWLKKALTSIKAVSSAKTTDVSLVKQTVASGSVFSSLKTVLKSNATYKLYTTYTAKIINSINKLLKKTNISAVAKTWLNKAKTLVNNMMFGKKSVSYKKSWLKKALTSINNVVKKNASNEVLRQESGKSKVFNSLINIIPEPAPTPDPVNPVDPIDPVNPVNPENPSYQAKLDETTTLINNLVTANGTSELAKSWLNAAKTEINEIINSNKTDAEKEELINKALTSVQNVANNNCSIEVLEQESAAGGIFSSLQETVLENNDEYQAYQVTKTYSEETVAIANSLSGKTGLSQSEILQQFAKAGVTNEQLAEVVDKINSGTNFINNSAIALSKVLNIDKNLIAVQQLAVATAKGSNISSNSSLENQLEIFKMNGISNAAIYNDCTLDELMANLKAGEGVILKVINGASFISVVKKNDNCFVVTDKDFTYNGEILNCEYTASEFKKLMNSQTASHTFTLSNGSRYSGTRSMYYNPANSEGKVSFISNSSGIKEAEDTKLNEQYVQPAITVINSLLNAAGTSDLAKAWLNKAKEIVSGIINGNNTVSEEEQQLKQVEKSIQRVVEQGASVAVLLQETGTNNLFSGLQEEVLNKDENIKNVIYPIYAQNVQGSVSVINNLLNNENLGETEQVLLNGVYNLIGNTVNEIANVVNSGNGDYSAQQQWLQQAAISIENIKNENVSLSVLDNETQEGAVFAPLRETLENTTTFQVYKKYGEIGANAIRTFAKYINVLESAVFQQFVRFNVTSEQIQNVGDSLMSIIKNGANFFNCASLAVSKYLGIDRNSAVVQDVAADISLGHGFGTDWMGTIGTNNDSIEKVLQVNGMENAMLCAVPSLEDLMNGLQVGEKAILAVYCYNLGGHAIMVKREANGWGVFDVNRNGGEEVIYTPENFITLMTGSNGATVQGTKADGSIYSDKVYYTAVTTYQSSRIERDENGGWNIINSWPEGIKLITYASDLLSLRDTHAILK